MRALLGPKNICRDRPMLSMSSLPVRFEEVFRVEKPLIAVVHLPPLPGSPIYVDDFESIIERGVKDAEAAVAGGADAVIVENFGDRPLRKRPKRATVAALAIIAREVARAVDVPVGVNVLRNDAVSAVVIAHVSGGKFIRVNAFTDVVASDQGLLEPKAWDVYAEMRFLGAKIAVLADILVKHGRTLSPPEPEDAARSAAYRGLASAIIVTGKETGAPPDPELLKRVKRAVDVPVLIGSGIRPDNVRLYAEADGFIVGTYLHREGRIELPIDEDRVREVARALRELR